jgi:hypothetical protein
MTIFSLTKVKNKMTVVSLFILFISTNCLGQVKDILFTHWERTDYDSLGKHIQENNLSLT